MTVKFTCHLRPNFGANTANACEDPAASICAHEFGADLCTNVRTEQWAKKSDGQQLVNHGAIDERPIL